MPVMKEEVLRLFSDAGCKVDLLHPTLSWFVFLFIKHLCVFC